MVPSDAAALIARLALAAIFIDSGIGKLADLSGVAQAIAAATGLPAAGILAVGAALLELVGGLALVFGVGVRVAALALAGFSALATVFFHAFWAETAHAFEPQKIQALKNLGLIGGLVLLAATGPGRWALRPGTGEADAMRRSAGPPTSRT